MNNDDNIPVNQKDNKNVSENPAPNNNSQSKTKMYSNSMRVSMKEKRNHIISASMLIIVVGVFGVFLATKSDSYITFGDDFFANNEDELALNEQIDNGYTFAFGTEPTDTTDYSTYSIVPANPQLREEFLDTINTSTAFEEIDSIYQIIDYDQFDKDGNISEQAMQDVINTGNAIEE